MTPEYGSWQAMLRRCYQVNHHNYPRYGARGIAVCERWRGKQGFENFFADMGERPLGRTLDRIDVNGNYTLENCRWATTVEQVRNRSVTKLSVDKARAIRQRALQGKSQSDIAHEFAIAQKTVSQIVRGERWKDAA